jgi:hypothetical protein
MADDEQARRERAERLREEIEALKSGRSRPAPKSPREFVDQQAGKEHEAEDEGAEEEDAEHPQPGVGGE